MFQCGTARPENWPSREVLVDWPSAKIVDYANESWFWGMSCEQQLYYVGEYFKCALRKDAQACTNVTALETRFKEKE